jgi:hypothetical protein
MLKKSRPTTNISWPDVVFYAEADQQSFADAQFITLYSHCLEISESTGTPLDQVKVAEHVEVFDTYIRVVIDEDKIDDDAIAKGLDLLIYMDDFDVGTRKEFGPKKSFSYKRLH